MAIKYPNDGVKATMDQYARQVSNSLGAYRRAVTRMKNEPPFGRLTYRRHAVEGAECDLYGAVRNAAHYAYLHGIIDRG